jgi:hypothetical protein
VNWWRSGLRFTSLRIGRLLLGLWLGFLPIFYVACFTTNIEPISAETEEQTNIRVYQLASPAVVSIRTDTGNGSGTIIDSTGLILTSAHVVRGARTVNVTLANQQRYPGEILAVSSKPDLAIIRLQGVKSALPTINLGISSQVLVGQRVFAIGDPFGRFAGTLTTGIVSRIDRDRQLIQTDAAINPGNSGGPLLNSQSELVGVNTAIFTTSRDTRTGLGFAISADTAKKFITAVKEGRFVPTNNDPIANAPMILANGKTLFSAFSYNDEILPDGSFFKPFKFEGKANQTVTIEMRSNEVDSFLALFDPKGTKISENDDGGGKKDAQIMFKLPLTGLYTIYANSYAVGEVGKFSLSARFNNSEPIPASTIPGSNLILQRKGSLSGNSESSPFDIFEFAGEVGQMVKITLSSKDFQPYLLLFAPNQRILKQDSASSDRHNANITLELPQTGNYRVVANTFERNRKGNYLLTVRRIR